MIDLLRTQDLILTYIVRNFPSSVKTKYAMTNANFTTMKTRNTEPVFPNVYIHLANGTEVGRTANGSDFGGVLAVFDVEVTDNITDSTQRSSHVSREVVKILKSLGFEITSVPITTNNLTETVTITSCRRLFADGDSLTYVE